MFGTSTYGNGSFGQNVANVIGSGLGQAVPALVRQTAQTIDPYKRDLGEYNTAEYYLNNLLNTTPLRMATLNPKLDNEGNVIEEKRLKLIKNYAHDLHEYSIYKKN